MAFRDRLLMAAAHAGVPGRQSDIARFLGLNRQTVNRWFRGTIPDTPMIVLTAKAFGVDATWLATEQGQMIPGTPSQGLTVEERDLIRFYRNAQPSRKKALYDMAKALGKVAVIVALTIPALSPQRAEAAFNISRSEYTLRNIRRWICVIFRTSLSYFAAPQTKTA